MAKKTETPGPRAPMNRWIRDALAFGGLSQQALADALSRCPGLGGYDRSSIYKMTLARKITLDEAVAIAAITGLALPGTTPLAQALRKFDTLSAAHQRTIADLIDALADCGSAPKTVGR